MFVESKNAAKENGFEAWGRAHPGLFTALLVVLGVAVTVGLLFQTGFSFVLYQGF